jgi:hypothetical protein
MTQHITQEQIRAAGGIVYCDGNIFFTNIDQLNAALAQPASAPAAVSGWMPIESAPKYLKNGMRFKISGSDSFGGELLGLPQDLIGQWVAFVDATDNTHLPAAPTGEPG